MEKPKKTCIVCNTNKCFTMQLCQNQCKYDVCVECTYKFSDTVGGTSFDKIRTRCMHCRKPLETSGQKVAFRLLRKRKKFTAIIKDRIIEGHSSILHKENGEISLAQVMEHSNHPSIIYVEYSL